MDRVTSSVRPPHDRPAESRRPHGANRFDVFSLKAGRRLTLFGFESYRHWLRLEADAHVKALCERPLVIRDTTRPRVVDFWISSASGSRYLLLLRPPEATVVATGRELFPAFAAWAREVGSSVENVASAEDPSAGRYWHDNWTEVLQHIVSFRGGVTQAVEGQVSAAIVDRCSVKDAIASLGSIDAEVARAAAYRLVHRGTHRFVDIGRERLSDDLYIEPA